MRPSVITDLKIGTAVTNALMFLWAFFLLKSSYNKQAKTHVTY